MTAGAATVLFIHGFLDDATVWDDVITDLAGRLATISYDLPGFGARVGEDVAAVTLSSLAAEAGGILDRIDTPVIVVGQSMGAQIADLVSAAHPDKVIGLVLLSPVPLSGARMPEEQAAALAGLGDDTEAHSAVRQSLSPSLTPPQLARLALLGTRVAAPTARHYVDLFNTGYTAAPNTGVYPGPVLVVSGAADGFVTAQMINEVAHRFPHVQHGVVEGGGHWLHVEHPQEVSAMILAVADPHLDTAAGWRQGFAEQSETAFAARFADTVVLEASTLARPVEGRRDVAAVMAAASSIYESLVFVDQADAGSTTYLQWQATAFGGVAIRGVTVLEHDDEGRIAVAAIHHRPLDVVLQFSAVLRDRLRGAVAADHFIAEAP